MSSSQYLKPNEKALENIDHVIVLMLENRSFDNLLGWLYDDEDPPRGQEFEGLRPDFWNPLDNVDADGKRFTEKVYVRKNGGQPRYSGSRARPAELSFTLPDPDPGEGFGDTNFQLFGTYDVGALYPPEPTNMGFVNNYASAMQYGTYSYGDRPTDPRYIMTCYTPQQTPVLSTLAREFAVCDQWCASVPSQTLPNRDFIHAATSRGQVNNKPNPDCDAKTVFQQIQDAIGDGKTDLSWRVYSGTENGKFFSLTRTIMTQLHDKAFDGHFRPIDAFYADAKKGNLPSYAFLEPQLSGPKQNDQHPNADIRPGEQLIADVYNVVVDSPQWEKTLLVITYDEHGGCYDHYPPPGGARPPEGDSAPPGQHGFRFNRFGVRVPTVLISPWIEAGTIARPAGYTPFDHTSVIATVQKAFGLDGPLTERDKAAPDLSCVLTLEKPRSDKPTVTPLPWQPSDPGVNDLHHQIAEVLSKLGGSEIPDENELIDYIHEEYARLFSSQRSR